MAGKIILPHPLIVEKWNEEKVIKWLKRVHLDDCVPAFEARHINGINLLELTEQKLFSYQDLKIKHRKQIAKCVQECKSQASNAKRIAKSIKHSNSHPQVSTPENGAYDSDDSDDWGTDFDDDDEEEVKKEETTELNNNTITSVSTGSLENILSPASLSSNGSNPVKFIPKPPDLPVISATLNGSNGYRKPQHASTIPRPPIKRPPSQPPPPPIPKPSVKDEPQEEYEVPIITPSNGFNSIQSQEVLPSFSNTPCSSESTDATEIETYEIISHVEEDYEIVDAPMTSSNVPDIPLLPPRVAQTSSLPPPPPLPQKPRKLHEGVQERPEGVRTFSRPKLPVKVEEEVQEINTSTSTGSIGSTFLTSLLGRRGSSTPNSSPKTQHRTRESDESVASNAAVVSTFESQSSRCSTPDWEVSATTSSSISGSSSDIKSSPPPPLPPRGSNPDETAQNMATRPLPPVPMAKVEDRFPIKSEELSHCPWFFEIEREDAERIVRGLLSSGSFLVRPSKRAGILNPYSLTILHEGRLFHLNIRQRSDNTFALGKEKRNEKTFLSVADLISYHQTDPILLTSRGEPAGTTILSKYPEKKPV